MREFSYLQLLSHATKYLFLDLTLKTLEDSFSQKNIPVGIPIKNKYIIVLKSSKSPYKVTAIGKIIIFWVKVKPISVKKNPVFKIF